LDRTSGVVNKSWGREWGAELEGLTRAETDSSTILVKGLTKGRQIRIAERWRRI
jgi:hypothetical protein